MMHPHPLLELFQQLLNPNSDLQHVYHQNLRFAPENLGYVKMEDYMKLQEKVNSLEAKLEESIRQKKININASSGSIRKRNSIESDEVEWSTTEYTNSTVKEEEEDRNSMDYYNGDINTKVEDSASSASYSPSPKIEEETSSEDKKDYHKFRKSKRNNGFKSSPSRKIIRKALRPRAKHLWVTFGRVIGQFALENSEGELHEWIAEINKKLTSKKGYALVFIIKDTDTAEEKEFKRQMRKLALKFLEKQVKNSFLNSNYRSELLNLKDKVKEFIVACGQNMCFAYLK